MGWPDSSLDPGLSRPLAVSYVYKSSVKRLAARLLDAMGDMWMAESARVIDWKGVRRIAVLRLDHLGDLLNAFPALAALRAALPHAEIDLFTGPWGAELGALCPSVTRVVCVEAPWFKRPVRVAWPWGSIMALGRKIGEGRYDLVFDLRGDLRHHLALWLSGTPLRVGHAVTAGRFLLTHPAVYDPKLHESDQNLALLRQFGLPFPSKAASRRTRSALVLSAKAQAQASRVIKTLKLGRGFVALQAACGTPAKRWMPEHWAKLILGLPSGLNLVLLGSAQEQAEMASLAALLPAKRRPKIAAGMLDLAGLAALLKKARLLISVDSGPAHLAAAMGTPVLALYSGTNRASQWGVRGNDTRLLQAKVPCSPCELSVCPYDNECMRRIGSASALRAAKAML